MGDSMTSSTSVKKTLDWQFWTALSLFALVAWLVSSSFIALEQSKEKDERIDTLIAGLRHQEEVAADERLRAANERAALLEYTKALAQRQRQIMSYLNVHGVDLPVRLLEPIPAPRVKGDAPAGKRSTATQQRRSSGGSTSTAPGKSGGKGKAPAHAKRH